MDEKFESIMIDERYLHLSENQKAFVIDAIDQGLEVDYGYSGRSMYGEVCPAIRLNDPDDFYTPTKTRQDHMGKGFVIYAQE